jgi:N-acetylmuramate 1-kinase
VTSSAPPSTAELAHWVEQLGHTVVEVVPLAGDVSFRRYFRVGLRHGSAVLAWYPPELADRFAAYVETTALLEGIGVRVPAILERSDDARFMLLEDGGDLALVDLPLGSLRAERHYRRSLDYATRIAALPPDRIPESNAPLDESVLRRELDLTWRVFLECELGADASLRRGLHETLDALCSALGRLRPLPCHRDLMARNLLVKSAPGSGQPEGLWLLDHQDLRLGPPHYDVASLLHDSSRLGAEQVERFESELLAPRERGDYARVCVQRLFKVVGTFHSFSARGDSRHLHRVPAALGAAARKLRDVPEGVDVAPALEERWHAR